MAFSFCSLNPVPVAGPSARHLNKNRTFQGIPSIGLSHGGRLFAVWYGGGVHENRDNYVMLKVSDDKGNTWSPEPVAVIDSGEEAAVRTFDSSLFTSADGRFFWFWSQCACDVKEGGEGYDGLGGVWVSELLNPDDAPAKFHFTFPRRIANGVLMNPPVTLSDGTWALPVSMWTDNREFAYPHHEDLGVVQGCHLYVSDDEGASFKSRGHIDMGHLGGDASYDEHRFIEMRDGSLKCYIRTRAGIAEAVSRDRGYTWTPPEPCRTMISLDSRICAGRLRSGNLLFIANDISRNCRRERLTAYLSEDDGATWPYRMLLDERNQTSYPDFIQHPDGSIAAIYDHDRYEGGEILLARFSEEDIRAGKIVSPNSRMRIPVDRTRPVPARQA